MSTQVDSLLYFFENLVSLCLFCSFVFVFLATVSGHDASGCIVSLYAFFQVLHLSSVQSHFFMVLFSLSPFVDVHMLDVHIS